MGAVRLSPKQYSTLSSRSQRDTSASAFDSGVKGTAKTSQTGSAAKPRSALEETLLLQIRASGLPDPVREMRIVELRRWRADFAWPEKMLMVECEGGHWAGGRHSRGGTAFDNDAEKYNEAALLGWRVLRVTSTHIKSGEALEWIRRALQ